MCIEWSSKLLCLACSQGWWFKTRQSQGSFQRGAAETLQQSFSGQQRRPQSLLKRCSSLLDFTHGAHGERLDPQRMRCDPRLAASWTCSDWTVELSWWSHCELVGNCVARSSAHCCASGGFCIIARKCLWHSIPGLTMISVWSESYTWHTWVILFSLYLCRYYNACPRRRSGRVWSDLFKLVKKNLRKSWKDGVRRTLLLVEPWKIICYVFCCLAFISSWQPLVWWCSSFNKMFFLNIVS